MSDYPVEFLEDLKHVLHVEGGVADRPLKDDPGGPTSHGITLRTYNAWRRSVKRDPAISKEQMFSHLANSPETIREIYYKLFWQKVNGINLPLSIRLLMFDIKVLQGVRGLKRVQAILGVRQDGVIGPKTTAAIEAQTISYVKAERFVTIVTADRWKYLQTRNHFEANKNGWRSRLNYMREVSHSRVRPATLDLALVSNTSEEIDQPIMAVQPVSLKETPKQETTVENESKGFLKSKTIWAGIVQLLIALAAVFGLDLVPGDVEAIPGLVEGIVVGITGVVTIIGRIVANRKLSVR